MAMSRAQRLSTLKKQRHLQHCHVAKHSEKIGYFHLHGWALSIGRIITLVPCSVVDYYEEKIASTAEVLLQLVPDLGGEQPDHGWFVT